ncbi:MAG: metallophosphoesterase [Ruminococcus sp.]|nr:metallophosphoesterase [Ruminococcus sp.]
MICVIGDTHGDYSRFSHRKIKTLGKNDYLIICGDFGFLWDGSDRERQTLKKIGAKRFTTLFVTGSHDNYELLEKYPEEYYLGGKARNICGRLYMLSSGSVFNLDGKRVFAFGGGQAADIDAGLDNIRWWEQELPDEKNIDEGRRLLRELDNQVDYIVTHEPPASIAEFLQMHGTVSPDSSVVPQNRLNIFFDGLKGEVEFNMWFFGKLHRNKLIPPRYRAVFDEPYMIE